MLSSLLSFVTIAHAGVVNAPKPQGFQDPNALVTQACNATTWIFAAAIIFSIVMSLIAAFEYMRSAGDPALVKKATSRLIYVAIGVAVALIAFLFPGLIATLLQAGSVAAC